MKHTIRRYGQLEQIDCELGSGVLDKNCREIIEGDIVSNGYREFPVKFVSGSLMIFDSVAGNGYDLNDHFARGFEVIGHIAEG